MRIVVTCKDSARGRCILAVALAATLVSWHVRAADSFDGLNEAFRQQHADAREREWARHGPVILVEFEKLTLFQGDRRLSAEVLPPVYNRLKSIAHAPFAVYLALEDAQGPLDNRRKAQLQDIATRLQAVRAALDTAGFSPAALPRQREILDRTATYIAATLKSGMADATELRAFAASTRPLFMKNVEEAAEMQIRGYDEQVAAWQHAFPDLNWRQLKVVITGSALPRKGNLATQYFAKLLGVPGEGERLVYAESLYEEPKALRLLNATAVDARAGSAFFDDSTYLHRDLMADVAARLLRDPATNLKSTSASFRP